MISKHLLTSLLQSHWIMTYVNLNKVAGNWNARRHIWRVLIVNHVHLFFFLLFNSSCPHYRPPITLPHPTQPHLWHSIPTPSCLYPWVLYTCSWMNLPFLFPIILFPHPLWLLSVCSLFPCLWFYFSHLFVLLIRFHLFFLLFLSIFYRLCYYSCPLFSPFYPRQPCNPLPLVFPVLSSCPWVVPISSLASPFPILVFF